MKPAKTLVCHAVTIQSPQSARKARSGQQRTRCRQPRNCFRKGVRKPNMSNPAVLIDKCRSLGLELWVEGGRIAIAPKQRIPTGLLDQIREAKPDLLVILRQGRAHQLRADCIPWLHIARQILAGEFEGGDNSTVQSLTTGLRSVPHPSCREALVRLQKHRTGTITS